ncbi:MAG TPA: signal peptidase I [Ideonella sp.]|jgi:signal peptidase I|nr:signal peptidase I [Ideonella sp.]
MKKWLQDNRGFIVFLICFGFFRTAIADYNPIPSGSMRPTLLEGDVVLVNRLAYDAKVPLTDWSIARLGEPQRGDVVTFSSPKDGERLIKRIVALPGDTVEMKSDVLSVNGVVAAYTDRIVVREALDAEHDVAATKATEQLDGSRRSVQFLAAVPARRDFGPLVVPPDHYFMLGDNRDNSEDSRYIGFVPRHSIIGRAHRILLSANILEHWQPRFDRTVAPIK